MPSACKMLELPLKCRSLPPLRVTVLACGLPSGLWAPCASPQGLNRYLSTRKGLELWLGNSVAAWISLLITLTGG